MSRSSSFDGADSEVVTHPVKSRVGRITADTIFVCLYLIGLRSRVFLCNILLFSLLVFLQVISIGLKLMLGGFWSLEDFCNGSSYAVANPPG